MTGQRRKFVLNGITVIAPTWVTCTSLSPSHCQGRCFWSPEQVGCVLQRGAEVGLSSKARLVNASSPHLSLCPASSLLTVPQMPLGPCPFSAPVVFQGLGAGFHPQRGPAPLGFYLASPPAQPWSGCQPLSPPCSPRTGSCLGPPQIPARWHTDQRRREHELSINEADFLTRLLILHLETEMANGRGRITNLSVNAQPTSCLSMSRVPWTLPKLAEMVSPGRIHLPAAPHMSPRPDSQRDSWPRSLEGRATVPAPMLHTCPDCLLQAARSSKTLPTHHRPDTQESHWILGPEHLSVADGKEAVMKK